MSMAAAFAALSAGFGGFTDEVAYARPSGGMATLQGFGHGLFGSELIAASQQYSHILTVRKADLEKAGLYPPQRFDRVTINGRTYSVETWKDSPTTGNPIFTRLMCMGGQT